MNPFAESNIACAQLCAQLNVARALDLLEQHASESEPDPALVGAAYAALLNAKGNIAAVAQLVEMEREFSVADTERPSYLRVVK